MLVAKLLRFSSVSIGSGTRIDQMHIGDLVQPGQQARHGLVNGLQIERFFRLGIGFVGDADAQVERAMAGFGQGPAVDPPCIGRHIPNGNGDQLGLLVQDVPGQARHLRADFAAELGIGLSR